MKECEDCGDLVSRRTRCKNCGKLVCTWCKHHVHNLPAEQGTLGEKVIQEVGLSSIGKEVPN